MRTRISALMLAFFNYTVTAKLPFPASRDELISVTDRTTKSRERYDTAGERKRDES